MASPLVLNDHRCGCGKLLFKGSFKGHVEIKCLRCGQIRNFYGSEDRDSCIDDQ